MKTHDSKSLPVFEHFLITFGTILGPFWRHFGGQEGVKGMEKGINYTDHFLGLILEPFWSNFGTILEVFGDHVGALLGAFGAILEQLEAVGIHLGAILGSLDRLWTMRAPFFHHFYKFCSIFVYFSIQFSYIPQISHIFLRFYLHFTHSTHISHA